MLLKGLRTRNFTRPRISTKNSNIIKKSFAQRIPNREVQGRNKGQDRSSKEFNTRPRSSTDTTDLSRTSSPLSTLPRKAARSPLGNPLLRRNQLMFRNLQNRQRNISVTTFQPTRFFSTIPVKKKAEAPSLKNAATVTGKTDKESLLKNLSDADPPVKYTREDIVRIGELNRKVVFLEKGGVKAGAIHILERHGKEFRQAGLKTNDEIYDAIMAAVTAGNVTDIQGRGRPIFKTKINGEDRGIAVTIGNNGYIVGANLVSRKNK